MRWNRENMGRAILGKQRGLQHLQRLNERKVVNKIYDIRWSNFHYSLPLISSSFTDWRNYKTLHARTWIVRFLFAESDIDNIADSVDGQTGLRNICPYGQISDKRSVYERVINVHLSIIIACVCKLEQHCRGRNLVADTKSKCKGREKYYSRWLS